MPQFSAKSAAAALAASLVFVLARAWVVYAQPNAAQPAPKAPTPAAEDSPLLLEPKTPEELFEATLLMLRLGRPELARQYLQNLLAADPDDATLLSLRERFGPDAFLRLARARDLQPASTQFLERMNQAFRRHATDPERIDRLITDLSGTPDERETAVIALRDAGPIVVPRMLQHVADPSLGGDRNEIVAALIRMGRLVVPSLLGALESPVADVRVAALDALGWVGSREIVPYLWHPAFAEGQTPGVRAAARQALARVFKVPMQTVDGTSAFGVAGQLAKTARQHFRTDDPRRPRILQQAGPLADPEAAQDPGTVAIWVWRPDSETLGLTRVSPAVASLYVGARFARQAFEIAPENEEYQALYLALALAYEAHLSGPNRPVPTGPGTAYNLSLTAGRETASKALSEALNAANTLSAVAALEVLSQVGTSHQLYKTSAGESPIIAALNFPSARVQFAAASTVLQLDPETSFSSAGRVVEIMARALRDDGAPHSLVVHPNIQQATTMAGLLRELDYEPLIAGTGRDAFRTAAGRRDVELIVLHANTIDWPLSMTVANLRADARTAAIPIVVYGPERVRAGVQRLLDRSPLMTFAVESVTAENLEMQLRPFLDSLKSPALSAEQRNEQKAAAAYWLAHIGTGRRTGIFDLAPAEQALIESAYDPTLAPNILLALGAIPSKSAQQQLQIVAINPQTPAPIRETAAFQLAFHVQRNGLLLDDSQAADLKTSWQAATDPAVATALASAVGSLKPNAARVAERLRQSPPPAPPVSTPTPSQ